MVFIICWVKNTAGGGILDWFDVVTLGVSQSGYS